MWETYNRDQLPYKWVTSSIEMLLWKNAGLDDPRVLCESRSVVSYSLQPHGLIHRILQARILEWVAFHVSRESSQPREQTQVSHIAGGFFISWATREAQEYWSG